MRTPSNGFTLIDLMIAMAVIAFILTMIPAYSKYSTRSNVAEALSNITAVQSAVTNVCQKDRTIHFLTNRLVGYKFKASTYVQRIELGGTCNAPTIVMTTRATGTQPSPVLTVTGHFSAEAEQFTWTCVSSSVNGYVPKICRS